jgi:hypothetical protein
MSCARLECWEILGELRDRSGGEDGTGDRWWAWRWRDDQPDVGLGGCQGARQRLLRRARRVRSGEDPGDRCHAEPLPFDVTDFDAVHRAIDGKSVGYAATIVNGEALTRNGKPTGARPGRLLRAGAA